VSTISYVSGSKCVGSGTHVIDNQRQVSVRLEGLCHDYENHFTVELFFENTLKMVLIPTPPLRTSLIFFANILYRDGKSIFLKDGDDVNEDIDPDSYDGTYIISERLKYRIIKQE
jgi:hypothetical protein